MIIRLKTKSTRKMKNRILAISAAPAAIPPNPKIAAMIATTRKMSVQRNMMRPPSVAHDENAPSGGSADLGASKG